MYSKDHHTKQRNKRFEGFLLDLLAEIAKRLDFDYEVYEVPDGSYGSRNKDGSWNGMINELIQGVSTISNKQAIRLPTIDKESLLRLKCYFRKLTCAWEQYP
jgi:hypothetical protein